MGKQPERMTATDALAWVVQLHHAPLRAASETVLASWLRQLERFSIVVIDDWPEQPARFSWRYEKGMEPSATLDELREFQEYVTQALTRAVVPDAVCYFPVKYGASENYQLYCNPDEDDYPTTCFRPDACMLLLKALLRWNRKPQLLRECPEWNKDQRARVKCQRFFLYETRSHEIYCQKECGDRANQRNSRKGKGA